MTALLSQAGFGAITTWTESLEHRWRASDHFEYQLRSTSRVRLQSLLVRDRETCLGRVKHRLVGVDEDHYTFRGDVVMALASKPG
jgi:hypothetical protein